MIKKLDIVKENELLLNISSQRKKAIVITIAPSTLELIEKHKEQEKKSRSRIIEELIIKGLSVK